MSLKDILRNVPLFGGLVDCEPINYWTSLGQVLVVLLLSTVPIWLGTLEGYALTSDQSAPARFALLLREAIGTSGLFPFCPALLAPIFWMALIDPPGARAFPSKLTHMVFIAVVDVIAAVFVGPFVDRLNLNAHFTFNLSLFLFLFSLLLLYLATLYHESRMPEARDEFTRQTDAFTAAFDGQHQ